MKIVKNKNMSKKYEARMAIWCLIALIILIVIAAYTQEVKAAEQKQYINYVVQVGDKVDVIAQKYYPDTYLLKARADIKILNHMNSCDIYPGQVLKLEVKM